MIEFTTKNVTLTNTFQSYFDDEMFDKAMPEGPEVETIKLGLTPVVKKQITEVRVSDHKKYRSQANEIKNLQGSKIVDIARKGKFLVFSFEKKGKITCALNHLGMTGVWYLYSNERWQEFSDPFEEYAHWKVYFQLSDSSHLLFVNVRTFGRFEMMSPEDIAEHKAIKTLGPDILSEDFDITEFTRRMRGHGNKKRTKEVGKCLLDYSIVAGCGNIYKNEALFLSKINPYTPANLLSDQELAKLGENLSIVANLALKFKGSSLQDYKMVDGYGGLMQNEFAVYDRAGEPCVNCKSTILKSAQGDRSSFWCPSCQNNYKIDVIDESIRSK